MHRLFGDALADPDARFEREAALRAGLTRRHGRPVGRRSVRWSGALVPCAGTAPCRRSRAAVGLSLSLGTPPAPPCRTPGGP
ncbi:hypothetical protein [Streptomyces sp. enrichment culture]|uniref:hypothetical protein n=1 Tax=Streptomyces sp. enrichment culture TaxID=1795815 RepID=UPI003F55D41B